MNETNVGLSVLPDGWVWMTITSAIKKVSIGKKKLKQKNYEQAGKLPVIDQGLSFIGGYTNHEELKVECQLPVVVFGDHTKAFKYVDFDFVAGADGIKVIKPEKVYYPKLFYYFAQAISLPDKGYARHFQFLEKAKISLPPLPEQHRIVAKIEELFTKLDAGKEELLQAKARLKRYRQSVLKAAMDGKMTKDWRKKHGGEIEPVSILLGRILKERREKWEAEQLAKYKEQGKTPPKNWRDKYKEPKGPDASKLPMLPEGWEWANVQQLSQVSGGLTKNSKRNTYSQKLPYLRVANVYADELRLEEIKDIGVKEAELNKILLKKGDMLVVEGNGSPDQIGRVAIWNGSISPCVHQNHIIKARFAPVEIGRYCIYWLLSIEGRKYISQVASSTSGLYTLSISKVSALPIPIPPLREQQVIIEEIERHLSVADVAVAVVDAELKRSDALRQSILKQAFSGKLVPQDPNDEPAKKLLERIKQEKAKQEIEQKTNSKTKKQLALFEH